MSLTGQLLDYSTIDSVSFLLSGKRPKFPNKPITTIKDIRRELTWEFQCLELLIESLILNDYVYLPAKYEGNDAESLTPLFESRAVKYLPVNWRSSSKLIQEFESLLNNDEESKLYLWNVSRSLTQESKFYSLRWEIRSFMWNVTIMSDTVNTEDLFTFRPTNLPEHYEDDRIAYEYMAKTFYYDMLARDLGLRYAPHPIRVPLLLAFNIDDHRRSIAGKLIFDELDTFHSEIIESASFEKLEIPAFFSFVMSSVKQRSEILPFVLSLRNSAEAKQFRSKVKELDAQIVQGKGGLEMAKYFAELKNMLDTLKKELGVTGENIESNVWLFSVPTRAPRHLFKSHYPGERRHFNWLKDIARKAADVTCSATHIDRIFGDNIV